MEILVERSAAIKRVITFYATRFPHPEIRRIGHTNDSKVRTSYGCVPLSRLLRLRADRSVSLGSRLRANRVRVGAIIRGWAERRGHPPQRREKKSKRNQGHVMPVEY
jgi:hypothetical protein